MPRAAQVVASRVDFIRRMPLFQSLPEADLRRVCRLARELTVPRGEILMREGTPGDGLYVVLEGELEVVKSDEARELVLARRGVGDFLGELSLLEDAPRMASVRAVADSRVLFVGAPEFRALMASSPSVAAALLGTVTERLRSTEATLMQREKLASLGTLAAGLAHELNNPAAAIRRGAAQLREVFREWERRATRLGALGLDGGQAERLRGLEGEIAASGEPDPDPLACRVAEEELEGWLDGRGLEGAWELAPPLAAHGFGVERLRTLLDGFTDDQLPHVLGWLAAGLEARELLGEIARSAGLISEIVGGVKAYAYLDQAPVQEVDLRASLESTLAMFRHRLRGGVTVEREYDRDLPPVEAFGSELSQVWTNLVDNALDAMGDSGRLWVRTRRASAINAPPLAEGGPDPGSAVVEIEDSGPGIPEGVRARIFDPFFTTKPPGSGSGLGLPISYNIVVDRHRGRIEVEAGERAAGTLVRVTLPLRLARESG